MSEEITNVEEPEEVAVPAKRDKKLNKAVEGSIVTIEVIGGEKGVQTFDVTELPETVQEAFKAFGLGHKLGDAAAGRAGVEAEEAIEKVWEGLLKGDWTTRTAAAPKVKMSEVKNALSNMSEEEAAAAKALMAKLGINL